MTIKDFPNLIHRLANPVVPPSQPEVARLLEQPQAEKGLEEVVGNHEGLDVTYRTGVTEQDAAGSNQFEEIAIRMGGKISDKLALKATFSHTIKT